MHPRASLAPLCFAASLTIGCGSTPATWSTPLTGLDRIVLSIWGPSSSELFVAGGCDPKAIPGVTEKTCPTERALAFRFDGSAWTDLAPPAGALLWWVWGFAPNDVWFAGAHGTILHFDGSAFHATPSGVSAAVVLYGIWGAAPGDLWAVGGVPDGSSTVLRYANGAWAPDANAPAAHGGAYYKVWGSGANDVWLVGQAATLVHWDGSAYHVVDVSGAGVLRGDNLFTVSGRSPSDVYAVGGSGQGRAIHFDGSTWAPVPGLDLSLAPGLFGVREDAAGDVSITGQGGAKFVGSGSSWRDDSLVPPSADLHATWLFAPDDVWAVGGNFNYLQQGVVAHYGRAGIASTLH